MSKLTYGKLGQVHFDSEEEKQIAIDYILNSPDVNFNVHENNQDQGAWAPEDRIHFYNLNDVPDCLSKLMTIGTTPNNGRINCKEFCDEIRRIALSR